MNRTKPGQSPEQVGRAGFTLVELMVAITIASVLTLIALPTVKDTFRKNVVSRGAKVVRSAIDRARAQAIRTGRPCGVVLERQRSRMLPQDPLVDELLPFGHDVVRRISYVQTASSYRGDHSQSEGRLLASGELEVFEQDASLLYAAAQGMASASRLINVGTFIRLEGFTTRFIVTGLVTATRTMPDTSVRNVSRIQFQPVDSSFNKAAMTMKASQTYAFEIEPLPIPAAIQPVELPGRIVLDLSISGTQSQPRHFSVQAMAQQQSGSNTWLHGSEATNIPAGSPGVRPGYLLGDVVIMFAADGKLDSIYADRPVPDNGAAPFSLAYNRLVPVSAVALAVGEADGMVSNPFDIVQYPTPTGAVNMTGVGILTTDDSLLPNVANPEATWVVLRPQTGVTETFSAASFRPLNDLRLKYGLPATNIPAVDFLNARILDSRRLSK
ncbi:pilus assembly FimT family protein [Rhodopirellula sp. P2]|uniref:pilus assembly FimT family protein n=1 Tax=Rhodopirellula sp. P2 TaxID=2127060 RepID=UPI00236845B9|nr:prepilin-type N-terminal cleavage/methylation domain-containing protein [Rhodopirellula sp. P2]WDQ16567.1 prepilin-type N-terminal cleavage/methylation domain-containing protein [Rhodopirellula sp. P2]